MQLPCTCGYQAPPCPAQFTTIARAHRVALAFDLDGVLVNHLAKALNEVHLARLQVLLVHITQALQLLVLGLSQGLPVVSGLTMQIPPAAQEACANASLAL